MERDGSSLIATKTPRCKCNEFAVLRTLTKEGPNCGRRFYCCPSMPKCGYFVWLSKPISPGESLGHRVEAAVSTSTVPSGVASGEFDAISASGIEPPPPPVSAVGRTIPRGLSVPPELWDRLYQFQREAVQFAIDHGGRSLIGDEMGLGKTKTAIAVATHFAERWPLLILCPSALRLNWRDELLESLYGRLDDANVCIVKSGKHEWPPPSAARGRGLRAGVVIMSYDMVPTFVAQGRLRAADFLCVVADESHALKSVDSQRTAACTPILQRAAVALLLTGTPALNRPRELFPQISMVRPDLFTSYDYFAKRYCAARMAPWGFDDSGCSNAAELQTILSRDVMIRRLKSDVLSALPPKVREFVNVPLTPKALAEVDALQKEEQQLREQQKSASSPADVEILSNRIRGVQNKAYSATGVGKVPSIVSHILQVVYSMRPELAPSTKAAVGSSTGGLEFPEHLAGTKRGRSSSQVPSAGTKLLVFAHHTEVIAAIEGALRSQTPPVPCVRIDGGSSPAQKQDRKNAFQADPTVVVAIVGITAAGVGLSFTAASLAIFAELHWTPGQILQAEDRIHRIGQLSSRIVVRYLVATNCIDTMLRKMLSSKMVNINATVNALVKDGHTAPTGFGEDDATARGQLDLRSFSTAPASSVERIDYPIVDTASVEAKDASISLLAERKERLGRFARPPQEIIEILDDESCDSYEGATGPSTVPKAYPYVPTRTVPGKSEAPAGATVQVIDLSLVDSESD